MSNRYLASRWCRDELKWFRKQIRDRAGEPGRVFVIRAQRTDTAAWPDFLRDERGSAMPGFSFYDPENGVPWGWPDLRETPRDFVKEMCRLQSVLTKRLRELRDRAERRAQVEAAAKPALAPPSGARRIYLHAPSDCESARADISRVLAQDGIVPLTAHRPAHLRRHLYVTCYTEGFSHFVTSMTAPVASGWSGCRVGLAPTGKRRLVTAHTLNSHCASR